MTKKELLTYVKNTYKLYPKLKDDILDLYFLCLDEIESGESEDHEIELCINDIDNLINEMQS